MKWAWGRYWPFCLSACAFLVFGIFLSDMRWAVRGSLLVLALGLLELLWVWFKKRNQSKKANSSEEQTWE